MKKNTKKILLHICCAGCGAYVSKILKDEGFEVVLFFYNPNIFPEKEYSIRFLEIKRVAEINNLEYFTSEYNHSNWLNKIKGLESEPEKGKRCLVCYKDRLDKIAEKAQEKDFDCFTSTLTVSPHKLAGEISRIGLELERKYDVKFLDRDFKKKDGFKKASEMSKKLNLYRQNYCGCEFSKK